MLALASKKVQLICLIVLLAVIPVTLFILSHIKFTRRTDTSVLAVNSQDESVLSVTPSPIKTVFVIVMENQNWSTIRSASSAAYINTSLLPNASYATQYYTPTGVHPSEANYLWMEAGANFGIKNDNPPSDNHQSTQRHLVTLLNANGISWKSYQEGIDGTSCPLEDKGFYAVRHNPMMYFDDTTDNNDKISVTCNLHVRPFEELSSDLNKNTVARYNFITPNLCDDMHGADGCPSDLIGSGDTWLSTVVPQIVNSQAYKDGGVIFITWDEGNEGKTENESSDGPIGMIVMSPFVKGGGYANSIYYTHSSLLKTIEEIFTVTPLLGDADNPATQDLSDLFIDISSTNAPKKIAMNIPTKLPTSASGVTNVPQKRNATITPQQKKTSTIVLTYTSTPTVTPHPSPAPTNIANATATWTRYTSGTTIARASLSFTYPTNWQVLYERTTPQTLEFLFFPPGSVAVNQNPLTALNGTEKEHMILTLYQSASSIQDFINKNFPDYKDVLLYSVYGKLGEKTIYEVHFPESDPRSADFGLHGIVIGKNYSYDVGFVDVMSKSTIDLIGNTIWPTFHID